jgi:hypothetical protein
MATEKQIIANQQNAQHSTGPRTESGKRRSRRNAIRHGLTAETIIDALEDPADYKAFERAIKSDYSPQTAVESQLVSRLVSLLRKILRLAQITQMGQGRIRQIQILRARFYGLHAWTIVSLKDLAATRQTCGVKQHRFCCC